MGGHMSTTSSITDNPISSIKEDRLKFTRYSKALSAFISESGTPLTIGLQGEWGTGKTSMMYMMREHFQTREIATSWVNTWEYSIFRGANETTPAILKGMLDKLKFACEEQGLWSLGDEADQRIKKVGRFLSNVANQAVVKKTGINVKDAVSGSESAAIFSEIAEVKADISMIIEKLLDDSNNPYQKVVFFVDDLDRIPPSDAVEVLEALKNIFDIPSCVFVLAIDYEVIVKGLEDKFGPKTEENEREFRSFFDKIIQVPFSMPTGAYTIEELLTSKLYEIGIPIPDDLRHDYAKVVSSTVGFNPRSLKRYMNSFSLLRRLRDAEYLEEKEKNEKSPDQHDDFILFVLLGFQISYPKIFRILINDVQFLDWDAAFALKQGVDLGLVREVVDKFDEVLNDKTDEIWEQIIYGYCNRDQFGGKLDPYLKVKWETIIDLLEFLRKKYCLKNDTERLYELLAKSMSFAAITNVDDDVETKSSMETKRKVTRFGSVENKYEVMLKDESTNLETLPRWNKIAIEMEKISEEYNLTIRVTASYVNLLSSDGEFICQLCNLQKRNLVSVVMSKKAEDPIPPSEDGFEFNSAKNNEERYAIVVWTDAGTDAALAFIRKSIESRE